VVNLGEGYNPAVNDEDTPAILAPLPEGESLLAWTERSSGDIQLRKLDAGDQVIADLPSLSGLEVHDAIPTANGFALAVVENDPDIYSPKYCRGDETPKNNVCGKMDVVLLNTAGDLRARTTLTQKANVDSVGAQFIWWYGHTARLATNGYEVGIYYRSAMSTDRPGEAGEVDIHAGDTLKFVDAESGTLLSGGWDWGCSHSWSVRLAHNGFTWAASCHGDAYPNAMRLARFSDLTSPSYTSWLDDSDPTGRALGGLVPSEYGFWFNYLQTEGNDLVLKLGKFEDAQSGMAQTLTVNEAQNLDSTYPFRPYMAAYAQDKLLLGWRSGGNLVIAVADAMNGELIEGPVTTSLSIDNFQDLKTTENGDVVWAHSGTNGQIKINRIAACSFDE